MANWFAYHTIKDMLKSITITTLAELYAHNYSLTAYCQNCQHSKDIEIERLADKLGPEFDYVIGKIASKLKCTEFGIGAFMMVAAVSSVIGAILASSYKYILAKLGGS